MTESTQLQTTDNNNTGVTKMEPPPPLPSTSPAPSTAMDHLQHHQQQYALKWNDFQTSILNSFRHLRDEEDFIDVTLACDKRSFTAHKVVLSACSPYFRKLLKANPCEHPIVILRDVHAEDVENLLSFMYNGEVNVSHEQLPDFLKTAHLLQIRGLADVNGAGLGTFNNKQHHNNNNTNNNNNNNNSISNSNNTSNNNNNQNNGNKFNFISALVNNSNSSSHNNNNNNTNNSNDSNSSNNCNSSSNSKTSTNNNNNSSSNGSSNNSTNKNNSSIAPFTAPTSLMSTTIAAAAAVAAGAANLAAVTNSIGSHNTSNSNSTNTTNTSMNSNAVTSGNTPAIQELKASSASPVNHHWDLADGDPSSRVSHLTPPPQKRIKSADLFRAQHGISPERLLIDREFPVAGQHPLTRERNRDRDRSRETSRDRDRNLELRESLLGQALENSNGQQVSNMQKPHGDLSSLHAQSAGEDSNSSDTEPSDRGDGQQDDSMNGSLDNQRSHTFPSAFLGLQGIPGLLPGPSGIGANDFVSRRSLEMRVRATDPRPCPKCGKIYRSAHTLRTHLEDKHTVCPGYRCVLCGTVAKSRNSLHSHMSRQHRGISTKDLPVLPMPSAFDPELASRLLAKAGVKISAAELRARASPTSGGAGGTCGGGNGNNGTSGGGGGIIGNNNIDANQSKLSLGGGGGMHDDDDESDDDPEDLTTGAGLYGSHSSPMVSGNDLSRYHESLLSNFGQHANTTISRIRNEAAAAAAAAAALGQQHQKELNAGAQIPTTTATTGQSLLDTYLQFITENTFGMGMSQEHAAAAALHAAKMAQLNAMGHGLEKIPAPLLQPQFDLSKLGASAAAAAAYMSGSANNTGSGVVGGLTIEPVFRRGSDPNCPPPTSHPPNSNGPTPALASDLTPAITVTANSNNIRSDDMQHDDAEPMNLGLDSASNAHTEGSHESAGIGNSGIGGAAVGSSSNNNNTNISEAKEEHKYNVDESGHHA